MEYTLCPLGSPNSRAPFTDRSKKVIRKLVHWYQYSIMMKTIERVQTGVRLKKRLLKVLKGLSEHLDMSLGDLLEGMSLHCFENKPPFFNETLKKIEQLKQVYDLDLGASDSHNMKENG